MTTFDAHQYTIDAGWDFTSVKLTAERGVSDEDGDIIGRMIAAANPGLTGEDLDDAVDEAIEALHASCVARVAG